MSTTAGATAGAAAASTDALAGLVDAVPGERMADTADRVETGRLTSVARLVVATGWLIATTTPTLSS